MHKSRNWLAALTLVGLLAFQAVPAFADVVITVKPITAAAPGWFQITVSYGPVFKSDQLALWANVTLSVVNSDGSRSNRPIFGISVDARDTTHKTLLVSAGNLDGPDVTFELRIKPGATLPPSQPTEPPQLRQPTRRLP
ncbi:MAG: hypothetical protein NUW01_18135 [Gemmatimonadaceae bacterium]|nr:hypothetical protein [Gemmatimonadaceae bacterium]